MLKRDNKSSDNEMKKPNKANKMKKISYDEHFTRATESIDLAKNTKFVDIDDGITKRKANELDEFTR